MQERTWRDGSVVESSGSAAFGAPELPSLAQPPPQLEEYLHSRSHTSLHGHTRVPVMEMFLFKMPEKIL